MNNYKHTIPVTGIIENDGKFLFIKRSKNSKNMAGKWVFPGGKCEKKEDVIGALYRELEEETGLSFTNDIAFLSSYQFLRAEDNSSSEGLVFLVRSTDRKIKKDPSCEEYRWINPSDICDYEFKYKDITNFDKETNVTIPGMEVHVRNALIIMKKNMFLDRRLFSVTAYQNKNCRMDKKYFNELEKLLDEDRLINMEFYPNKK